MAVMGRPKSDNPKVKNVTVRLTEKEYRDIYLKFNITIFLDRLCIFTFFKSYCHGVEA